MKTVSELKVVIKEIIKNAQRLDSILIYKRSFIENEDYEDITAAIEMAENLIFQSLQIAEE